MNARFKTPEEIMKKTVLLMTLAFFVATSAALATQRMPLVEMFTNTS